MPCLNATNNKTFLLEGQDDNAMIKFNSFVEVPSTLCKQTTPLLKQIENIGVDSSFPMEFSFQYGSAKRRIEDKEIDDDLS